MDRLVLGPVVELERGPDDERFVRGLEAGAPGLVDGAPRAALERSQTFGRVGAADPAAHSASRRYTSSWARAHASQLNSRARASPRSAYGAGSSSTASIARAMSPADRGSKSSAASPHTSGSEVAFEAATGQPQAIASSGGRPKPS